MKYHGLETIAYLTTLLGSIRDHCPNVIGAITPYDARQLDLFVRRGGIEVAEHHRLCITGGGRRRSGEAHVFLRR